MNHLLRLAAAIVGSGCCLACAGEQSAGPTPAPHESEHVNWDLSLDDAINDICPRSGEPIVVDSLTKYRGHVVGFCNTHCRDDFADDPEASPEDREFFDRLIAKL